MKKTLLLFALIAGVFAVQTAPSRAEDWPQWRGPNRDGVVPGFQGPKVWPKELKRQWSVEVGTGHASPVVAGQQVFLISREGENEVVQAMNLANGKTLWLQKYPAPFTMSPYATAHGKGPKSTPVIADDRLYTLGIGNVLTCWDARDGSQVWQHDLSKQYTKSSSLWYGQSASPVVDGDLLIAQVGGCDEGAVVALDRKTGAIRWQWTGDGAAYASPMLATAGGVRHVLSQSQSNTIDLSAADGSLLWKSPFKTDYDQNIITPVLFGELVLFGGLKQPTAAFRLQKSGEQWSPVEVWANKDCSLYMSTPVLAGDRLIALANTKKGQFFCLDAASGKTLWTSNGRMGNYAAMLVAGAVVLAQTDGGELLVIDPLADHFEILARYKVSEQPTWAYPAMVGGKILIKAQESLALWTIGE